MPERIQLTRAAGFRKPAGAIVVARPTRWGNPFRYRAAMGGLVREPGACTGLEWEFEGRISADGNRHDYFHPGGAVTVCHVRYATRRELVELYRRALLREDDAAIAGAWGPNWQTTGRIRPVNVTVDDVRRELAGRDLCCWCPPGDACHADVLLAVANGLTVPRLEVARV